MDKILIAILTFSLGIISGIQISYFSTDHPSKLENWNSGDETKIASGRYIRAIDFKNHSYIHLRNSWNSVGDKFFHDPACKCYINKEK